MTQLLDQFGNPIDLGRLREPQTAETGWLHREFENHPAKGLTPSRLHQVLLNAEQGDLLEQLDLADDIEERDGHVYAELAKRKGAVSALEWDVVEPEGASAAEKKLTEEVREWMKSLPDFEDVLNGMMDGVLKGYAAHEMVWRLEGKVMLPQLSFRPQRWFTLDQHRQGLLLRSQTEQQPAAGHLPAVMGEPLYPFAWLMHQPRSRNGYLARSALVRVLAWPYIFKNYSVRDLAEFLEIYGLPLRLGQYPAGASDQEKRTLLRAVTEIGHNAAGIIPQGMKVEFQNAAQGTHVPFLSMMTFMDGVESKVILGQTLTASEGQNGTQALGNVHNEVRKDIRASDVRQVEGTVDRQLIYPLAVINRPAVDPKRLPRFKLDTGEAEDIKDYADALPKLVGIGLRIPVQWAHEKLRIPKAEEADEVLASAAPPAADPNVQPGAADPRQPPAGKPPARALKAEPLAGTLPAHAPAARDALDDLVDEALGDWQRVMSPMVEPLLGEIDKAIAAGESPKELLARLPELGRLVDGTRLAQHLARANFVARLAGEADLSLHPEEEP